MSETISSKEAFQYAENSEDLRAWKTDLRRNWSEAGTKQMVGTAADGFGSGAAAFSGGRRCCRGDGHDVLRSCFRRHGFPMSAPSPEPSLEVSSLRNHCGVRGGCGGAETQRLEDRWRRLRCTERACACLSRHSRSDVPVSSNPDRSSVHHKETQARSGEGIEGARPRTHEDR